MITDSTTWVNMKLIFELLCGNQVEMLKITFEWRLGNSNYWCDLYGQYNISKGWNVKHQDVFLHYPSAVKADQDTTYSTDRQWMDFISHNFQHSWWFCSRKFPLEIFPLSCVKQVTNTQWDNDILRNATQRLLALHRAHVYNRFLWYF